MKTTYCKSSLVLAACMLLATTLPAQQTQTGSGTVMQYTRNSTDAKEQMMVNKNGKRWELEFKEEKLTALKIDGVAVPEEKWGEYSEFIKEMREQLKRDREQAEKDRIQAGLDRIQVEKDRAQAKLDRVQAEKDRAQAVKDRERAGLDRIQAEKDRQQAEKDRVQAEKDRAQSVKDRQQADLDRVQAEKDRAQADKDREQAQLDRIQAEKDRAVAAEDRRILNQLTSDLVTDKLVEDAKALQEFTLNSSGMTVNGLKQPEGIAKKYQEKYSRFAKTGMTYRSNGTTRQYTTGSNIE